MLLLGEVGKTFRRFELHERIGLGGMAEVFRATASSDDGSETVVVKKILPHLSSDPQLQTMFADEARVIGTLAHPNIVRLLDSGKIDDQLFLALEYVDGTDLAVLARAFRATQRKIPLDTVLYLVRAVLDALEYAHAAKAADGTPLNIVHRDVSPGNILLSRGGDVKLTDFGIARNARRTLDTTRVGTLKGNVHYMAPEQITGRDLDHRADIYALGMVLYAVVAGKNPFEGDDVAQTIYRVLGGSIPSISMFDREIPKSLEKIVTRATRIIPALRFSNAAEFRDAIDGFVKEQGMTLGAPSVVRDVEDAIGSAERPAGFVPSIIVRLGPMIAEAVTTTDGSVFRTSADRLPVQPDLAAAPPTRDVPTRALVPGEDEEPTRLRDDADHPTTITDTAQFRDRDSEPAASLADELEPEPERTRTSESDPAEEEPEPQTQESVDSADDDAAAARTDKVRVPVPTVAPVGRVAVRSRSEPPPRLVVPPPPPLAPPPPIGGLPPMAPAAPAPADAPARKQSEAWSLEGHRHPVSSIAVGGGGSTLVSGSHDETIRVWDTGARKMLRILRGHRGHVEAVAITGDGSRVVSGARDKTVKLWDCATGELIRTFKGHGDRVYSVAISEDGRHIVSGSNDRTVMLWSVERDEPIRTIGGHRDMVTSVSFFPDGLRAVSGAYDCTIRIWDLETSAQVFEIDTFEESVRAIAVSPDGRLLLSAGAEGTIRLWDCEHTTPLHAYTGHTAPVVAIRFSPDGKTVLSASYDGTLRLWDVFRGKAIAVFEGHKNAVLGADFFPDGNLIASSGSDNSIRIWKVPG